MLTRVLNHFPHPYVFVFFTISVGFLYFNAPALFSSHDVPWHIAAGDYIRAAGSIPLHDPWSYTAGDTPWYNISWAWDVLSSVIVKYSGYEGLYVFTIMFCSLILTVLGYSLFSRKELKEGPVSITVCLVGFVLWESLYARPQLVTYMMVLLFHHFLHHSRANPTRLLPYVLLPLLTVIWANCHGGFLAGFIIIGAFGIEAYCTRNFVWLWRLILTGLLCTLSTLCTPYGVDMFFAVQSTLFSVVTPYITEWRSFSYGTFFGMSIFFVSFVFVSSFKDESITMSDRILAALWFIAAIYSVRNFAIFAILASPYFALRLQQSIVLQDHPFVDTIKNRFRMAILSFIIAVLFIHPTTRYYFYLKDNVYVENQTPFDAIDYIANEHPDVRFMNHYDLGGHILLRAPDISVFVDGRAGTAYPESILEKAIAFSVGSEGWEQTLNEYKVNGVIVRPDMPFPPSFHENWHVVYDDMAADVYLRNNFIE